MPPRGGPPDLADLFRRIREFADHFYPGHGDLSVRIEVPGHRPTVLQVPPACPCPDPGAYQPAPAPANHFRHTPDFRGITWYGMSFRLSRAQAAVVETLCLAMQQGRPDVDQETLLRAAGTSAVRVADLFRRTSAAGAWGTMIVPGDIPGTFRLSENPPGHLG